MVIEINQTALEAGIAKLDELSSTLDDFTDKRSRDSLHQAIGDEVDEQILNPVLQRARSLGRPHAGDHVEDIQPVSGDWSGDTYTAGLRSDNEVVLSHEYGSGIHDDGSTYTIRPRDPDGALAFEWKGRTWVLNYVQHPGVRGKRFMHRAIQEKERDIAENARDRALDQLDRSMRNAGGP
jgi:hypothetical protein